MLRLKINWITLLFTLSFNRFIIYPALTFIICLDTSSTFWR